MNLFYYLSDFPPLNFPSKKRTKSRPYTKGAHNAKMANKRHKRNKAARRTRKRQRR